MLGRYEIEQLQLVTAVSLRLAGNCLAVPNLLKEQLCGELRQVFSLSLPSTPTRPAHVAGDVENVSSLGKPLLSLCRVRKCGRYRGKARGFLADGDGSGS